MVQRGHYSLVLTFLYLPLVFVPEADSLKHPQSFYLTKISPQTVFVQHSKYPTKPMEFAVFTASIQCT
ncbi:hypothetical protein GTU87_21490 [Escherichia coli]|nr:hypothetical protein [Escherichia coli]